MLSPRAWAERHFGGVDLKDARLNRRVVRVAAGMAADPSASIPRQCGGWAATKGAYRMLADPGATFKSVGASHWRLTREEAGREVVEGGDGVVLFVQDTTWLSFGHHPATRGLGRHGRGESRGDVGLNLHSVLAVRPESADNGDSTDAAAGVSVLGVAHAKLWARDPSLKHANAESRSKRRRHPERESLRWGEAVREVGSAPAGMRYLHVGDREADGFDLFEQTTQLQRVGFVVRVSKARNALPGHDAPQQINRADVKGSTLKDLIRNVPVADGSSTRLAVAANNGRTPRVAELLISHAPVTLYAPQMRGRNASSLRCWCVRVFEPDPPAGVTEPIEWIILTSEPVNHLADARRIARSYQRRWLIEEYHRCLKSGCKIEESQLSSMQSLSPMIGLASVVAARLLQLKNEARLRPDAPATDHAPVEMVEMVCLLRNKDPRTLSLRQFVREVARHGGFLARRRDGEPGWQTLWHGWQKLALLREGWRLAQSAGDVGKG